MAIIEVDGVAFEAQEGTTVKEALEELGLEIARFPGKGIFMPCQTGGCWSCAMEVDGLVRRACVTPVGHGMKIETGPVTPPRRIVGGFSGHPVGGVGTPWWLKGPFVEVACFAAGCNLRCPQCQNWQYTYMDRGAPMLAEEAAKRMAAAGKIYGVDRLAISGGECTLNRPWLVSYLECLGEICPCARLHVDTNGSILTGDYLDDLVSAGMTDIGLDLKAGDLQTYMRITGLADASLGRTYMETAWQALEHLLEEHPGVFVGVGVPYNAALTGLYEVKAVGQRIAALDPWVQVCVLDYRPEFQRRDISRPGYEEMARVHGLMQEAGLESVLCQTSRGRIGPDGTLLP